MNISIIGLGYVGCVDMACFASLGHHVFGVDLVKEKVDSINSGKPLIKEKGLSETMKEVKDKGLVEAGISIEYAVNNSDITFVAVDTPYKDDGLDMSHLYAAVEQVAEALKKKKSFHILAVRSTVMPGTARKVAELIKEASGLSENKDYAVVINPELLREGCAVSDFFNPPYILIGAENEKATETMKRLYKDIDAEIITESFETIEMMKFVNNTYHAMKVTFANEIGNICSSLGVDSHKVMDIFTKDTELNISPCYFRPGFAYGGSCLPKDMNALRKMAELKGIKTPVIDGIEKSNESQIVRATNLILATGKKKIALLGLSFKEGTDDIRFSPILKVIDSLQKENKDVGVFDYNISKADIKEKKLVEYICDDKDKLCQESDVIVITNTSKDYADVFEKYPGKYVIDLSGKYRYREYQGIYRTIN